MKYWRGFLVAGLLGFFTWALLQFAKSHTELVDMFYPYVTRMVQGSLAQWSGATPELLWQLVLVLVAVVILATIVLMIALKWNPIQWLGWILAIASLFMTLNVGVYGLNDYAGPLADDIKLNMTEYTLNQLKEAAIYYRDYANQLAEMIGRDNEGNLKQYDLDEISKMASNGYLSLTYDHHIPIFYGTAIVEEWINWTEWEGLPVKELGWTDYYTSIGTTMIHTPLTGEVAVNTQIPIIAQPFYVCKGLANRLSIANDGDAEFAAFLACAASSNRLMQYSGYFMAYLSCRDAIDSMYGAAAKIAYDELVAGEGAQLAEDIANYEQFFEDHRDEEAIQRLKTINDWMDEVSYNVRDFFGVEKLTMETASFYDVLVSWHIQEIVLPTVIPEVEENPFDPYYEDYINGLVDREGNPIVNDEGVTE